MTSNTAAKILGVHPSTIKRHCSTGRLQNNRTEGGHLRIDADHLADYLHLNHQGHILHSVGDELNDYLEGLRAHFQQNDDDALKVVLFSTLMEGREYSFHAMIDHLFEVYPDDVLVLGPILLHLLRIVEIRYSRSELSIADEHRITQIIRDSIIRYHFNTLEQFEPNGKQVVVGCAERDPHDITALLTRSVFMLRGYTVRYLGADVPNEEFRREQERWNADIVCISRTLPSGPGEDRNLLSSLIVSLHKDRNFEIVLGGLWSDWSRTLAQRHSGFKVIHTLKELDELLISRAMITAD